MAESTYRWGSYIGGSSTDPKTTPTNEAPVSNIAQLAASNSHSLALDTSGVVWGWGCNESGQLGNGTTTNSLATAVNPLLPAGVKITSIGEARNCSLAIDTNGNLWYWGTNQSFVTLIPQMIPGPWAQVVGGQLHIMLLDTSGNVWGWGYNAEGQLGLGTTTCNAFPQEITGQFGGAKVASITSGNHFSGAIDVNGLIWCWGYNAFGQVGNGTLVNATSPVNIVPEVSVKCSQLSCGGSTLSNGHTICLLANGHVWSWGCNANGQLGNLPGSIPATNQQSPVNVTADLPGGGSAGAVFAGGDQTQYLSASGNVWMVGLNTSAQIGNGSSTGSVYTAWFETDNSTSTNLISTTAANCMCHHSS